MTDQEVIETLARREGWTRESEDWWRRTSPKDADGWVSTSRRRTASFYYLTSRDAIQSVLAGLTEEEWKRLGLRLDVAGCLDFRFALTLPPEAMARAVAEVLKGQS